MTKRRQVKKLWSYWFEHDPLADYKVIWQIVPQPDEYENTEVYSDSRIWIKMLYFAGDEKHPVKVGETMVFRSYKLQNEDTWTPILKDDAPLIMMKYLDL